MRTAWALMVMPRSRSRSSWSSTCSTMSRGATVPVNSSKRSESVVLPWSTWAMTEMARIDRVGVGTTRVYGRGLTLSALQGASRAGVRSTARAVYHGLFVGPLLRRSGVGALGLRLGVGTLRRLGRRHVSAFLRTFAGLRVFDHCDSPPGTGYLAYL